jgi:large subunit ribosomal protein L10
MLKQEKEQIVAELAERLRTADTLFVADYRGLDVTEIDRVRTQLLSHGARFTVVKNTLTKRAAEVAGVEDLNAFLDGPTAIAFVTEGDMVAVAKALNDTARETRVLALKGGILGGRSITADDVRNLASLPPADVLRGQVLGAVVGPLNAIAALFTAPLREFVSVVDARIRDLEERGESAEAPPAEPEAAAERPPPDEEEPEAPGSAEDQQTPSSDPTLSAEAETENAQTDSEEG